MEATHGEHAQFSEVHVQGFGICSVQVSLLPGQLWCSLSPSTPEVWRGVELGTGRRGVFDHRKFLKEGSPGVGAYEWESKPQYEKCWTWPGSGTFGFVVASRPWGQGDLQLLMLDILTQLALLCLVSQLLLLVSLSLLGHLPLPHTPCRFRPCCCVRSSPILVVFLCLSFCIVLRQNLTL